MSIKYSKGIVTRDKTVRDVQQIATELINQAARYSGERSDMPELTQADFHEEGKHEYVAHSQGYKITVLKNNDGNYEPTNCRWATRKEQRANQRGTKK